MLMWVHRRGPRYLRCGPELLEGKGRGVNQSGQVEGGYWEALVPGKILDGSIGDRFSSWLEWGLPVSCTSGIPIWGSNEQW